MRNIKVLKNNISLKGYLHYKNSVKQNAKGHNYVNHQGCNLRMHNYTFIIFLIMFGIVSENLLAFKFDSKTCQEYGLGSNWYCGQAEEKQSEFKELPKLEDVMKLDVAPEEKAKLLGELHDKQVKRATITERDADIKEALRTQSYIVQKGVKFGTRAQFIAESTPSIASNNSIYGNEFDKHLKADEEDKILNHANQRYALAFIYNASCPHCIRQLPIISMLRQAYGIEVLGVTPSNEYFPNLDGNITDETVVEDPMVVAFPTMMLIDKQTQEKVFVAKGVTSLDRLKELIVKQIKEREDV